MLLEPLSKCPGGFPYIFFITPHPMTFISVDDSTFLQYRIFVLWSHQEVFDGITSFKVDLHSMFVACSLDVFIQPFVIWQHYAWILVVLLIICIAIVILLLVSLGHHTISSKYSVICTLHHRAKTICSSPHLLQQEEDHLHSVLQAVKHPYFSYFFKLIPIFPIFFWKNIHIKIWPMVQPLY